MRWRQYGRNGVLIEFAEKPDEWAYHKSRAISEALALKPPTRLLEFVPGYTTVLLEFDLAGEASLEALAAEVIDMLTHSARNKITEGPVKSIPIIYDGSDLQRVAAHNRITVEQAVAFHSGTVYKVHLLGFSPGFPYLGELHHRLHTPRLATPRQKVPAGSVAIGGHHTGIYSIDSPGGWNIVGRTEIKIFDPGKAVTANPEEAFFLTPGDRVRFVPVK